jgi:hypothetical protein
MQLTTKLIAVAIAVLAIAGFVSADHDHGVSYVCVWVVMCFLTHIFFVLSMSMSMHVSHTTTHHFAARDE